jgi:hypothetical protein
MRVFEEICGNVNNVRVTPAVLKLIREAESPNPYRQ